MLIELFAILLIVSIFLIFLGFYTSTQVLSIVGFFFIFLLSFTLTTNTLQYEAGAKINQTSSTHTIITYDYQTFSDNTRTYGIYLAIASALGMILCFFIGKEYKIKS